MFDFIQKEYLNLCRGNIGLLSSGNIWENIRFLSSGNGTVGCYPEGILESLQMEYWILSRGYTRTFPVGILGFTQREYWILSNRKIDCACCARDLFLFLVSAKGLCSEPTALERRRRTGEGGVEGDCRNWTLQPFRQESFASATQPPTSQTVSKTKTENRTYLWLCVKSCCDIFLGGWNTFEMEYWLLWLPERCTVHHNLKWVVLNHSWSQ